MDVEVGRPPYCVGLLPRRRMEKIIRCVSGSAQTPEERSRCDVALHRIMDSVCCMIPVTASASRFYGLFARAGVEAAVVVKTDGGFAGVITKSGLIVAARRLEEEHHQSRDVVCGESDTDSDGGEDSEISEDGFAADSGTGNRLEE
eukprot:SRR837773.15496.p1 GENE.SRR837773.15496~~SRR837773.15496.p1  ORF type:complete len:166 (+),score=3.60 SRR837773.15496:62-499(+)